MHLQPDKTRLYLWPWQDIHQRADRQTKTIPSFAREYDLQYLGLIGNTFHTKDIDRAVELGIMTLIV